MHDENNKPDQLDASASSILSSHKGRKASHKFKATMLVAIFCAALMITCVTVKPVQDAQAIAPLVIGGIILGSMVAGWLLNEYFNGKNSETTGGGMSASDFMKQMAADRTDLLKARSDQVDQLASDLDIMQSLYIQRANILAYNYWRGQETANTTHTWNYQNAVFTNSTFEAVAQDMKEIMLQVTKLYNSVWTSDADLGVIDGFMDLSSSFIGTYQNCKWGFYMDSSPYEWRPGSPGVNYLWPETYWHFDDTALGYKLFMDVDTKIILQGMANNYVIKNNAGQNVYWINNTFPPYYNIYQPNLTAGVYTINYLSGAGQQYGQFFLNHGFFCDVNAPADILKGAIAWWGANNADLSDKSIKRIVYQDSGYFSWDPAAGVAAAAVWNTQPVFSGGSLFYVDMNTNQLVHMNALAAKVQSVLLSMANSAQAYYNWCVVNNPTSAPPDPTWAFPDPSQYEGMTMEQWLLIWNAWMAESKDWFNNNTNQLPSNITISPESLDLKVRGAIYNETGVKKYSNLTIFTPLISTASMKLVLGWNNLTQSGRAVIWGYAPTIAELGQINRTQTVAFSPGWKFFIEEMMYRNQSADEVDLTLTHLNVILTDTSNTHGNGTAAQSDAEWLMAHWYYAAIVLGIIFLVAAMATRNAMVGLVGLICLAAGAAGYFLQDFSLSNELGKLFKFEISQLHSMIGRWK